MKINIMDHRRRDAVVELEAVRHPRGVRWLDESGRQASSVRLLKASADRDLEALMRRAGSLEEVARQLIDSDPEVDIERFGRYLREASSVYVDPDGRVVHHAEEWEVVRAPDGSERERRPRVKSHQNVCTETPLVWTGRMVRKDEVFNRYVFTGMKQLVHVNGLTFDFLFGIARELEARQSMLLLGAGPKGNEPMILQRGGKPYRGFLEGRTRGDSFCLVLHLSNMELKRPAVPQPE